MTDAWSPPGMVESIRVRHGCSSFSTDKSSIFVFVSHLRTESLVHHSHLKLEPRISRVLPKDRACAVSPGCGHYFCSNTFTGICDPCVLLNAAILWHPNKTYLRSENLCGCCLQANSWTRADSDCISRNVKRTPHRNDQRFLFVLLELSESTAQPWRGRANWKCCWRPLSTRRTTAVMITSLTAIQFFFSFLSVQFGSHLVLTKNIWISLEKNFPILRYTNL